MLVDKSFDMVQIFYKIKLDILSISIVTRLRNGRPGGRFAKEDYLLFIFFFYFSRMDPGKNPAFLMGNSDSSNRGKAAET